MKNETRYQQLFEVVDISRTEGTEIAAALSDPYTLVNDVKSGKFYIAWDLERAGEMSDEQKRIRHDPEGGVSIPDGMDGDQDDDIEHRFEWDPESDRIDPEEIMEATRESLSEDIVEEIQFEDVPELDYIPSHGTNLEIVARALAESDSWMTQREISKSVEIPRGSVSSSLTKLTDENWVEVQDEDTESRRHHYKATPWLLAWLARGEDD